MLPTTTGSVILRLARRETAATVLQTQWTGEGAAILDRQGRRCSTRLLGAPHLDDIERPVHQTQGRAVVQITVEHSEEREDPPANPHQGVMPPDLSKQFFRCALTAKAICTAPLANLELPTVEQLAEAIINQRINTPPEL
eukprot:jgi/Tetstr1/444601/TSEL_032450.t1